MIDLKTTDKVNIIATGILIFLGVLSTAFLHSWYLLISLILIVIAVSLISFSVEILSHWRAGKRPYSTLIPLCFTIIFSAVASVLVMVGSVAERIVWVNADHIPSFIITHQYGDNYNVNKHRLFNMECKNRGMMQIRVIDGVSFARCGDWFPETVTLSAPEKAFFKAMDQTINDPENMPVVVEGNDNG